MIIAVDMPIINAEETQANFDFWLFCALYCAVSLLTVKGRPLEMKVSRTVKTEKATWYIPSPVGPIARERIILSIKPRMRVSRENIVIMATVLKIFFTFHFSKSYKYLIKQTFNLF